MKLLLAFLLLAVPLQANDPWAPPLLGNSWPQDCDQTVVLTIAAVNTNTVATHKLGHVPVGYWVIGSGAIGIVYNGSGGVASWTTTTITLRAAGPGWDETKAIGTYLLVVF